MWLGWGTLPGPSQHLPGTTHSPAQEFLGRKVSVVGEALRAGRQRDTLHMGDMAIRGSRMAAKPLGLQKGAHET